MTLHKNHNSARCYDVLMAKPLQLGQCERQAHQKTSFKTRIVQKSHFCIFGVPPGGKIFLAILPDSPCCSAHFDVYIMSLCQTVPKLFPWFWPFCTHFRSYRWQPWHYTKTIIWQGVMMFSWQNHWHWANGSGRLTKKPVSKQGFYKNHIFAFLEHPLVAIFFLAIHPDSACCTAHFDANITSLCQTVPK